MTEEKNKNGNGRILDKDTLHYLIDHSHEIVARDVSEDKYQYIGTSTKILNNASVLSVLSNAIVEFKIDGKISSRRMLAKYYDYRDDDLPEGYMRERNGGVTLWGLTYDTYKFLEGIRHVPKAYHLGERIIIVEYVGEETLEKRLEKLATEQQKVDFLKFHVIPALAEFHDEATERFIEKGLYEDKMGIKEEVARLFNERKIEMKVPDYLRGALRFKTIGKMVDAKGGNFVGGFVDAFVPIARKALERDWFVCQGDLNTMNIILDSKSSSIYSVDKKDIYIIDPKLKLRDSITDITNKLACPGLDFEPRRWEELAIALKQKEMELRGARPVKRLPFPWTKPAVPIDEENIRKWYKKTLECMTYYPFRRFSKDTDGRTFFPSKYRMWMAGRKSFRNSDAEMRKKVIMALNELLDKSEELGINKPEHKQYYTIDNLKKSLEYFKKEIFTQGEQESHQPTQQLTDAKIKVAQEIPHLQVETEAQSAEQIRANPA